MQLSERWKRLHPADRLSAGLVLLFLLAGLRAVPDMGMTWDGDDYWNYGHWVWDWYRSHDPQSPALTNDHMPFYGALFGVIGTALEKLTHASDHLRVAHTVALFFGCLGVVYAIRIGRLLLGPWGGLLTGLLLVTAPRWFGDSMFNPVDIPFAATSCASVFYLLKLVKALPAPPWQAWVRFGVATGLAMAVRIGGVLAFAYLGLLLALWALNMEGERGEVLRKSLARLLGGFAGSIALGWLVAAAFWPKLLLHPIRHTLDSLVLNSKFTWAANQDIFQGKVIPASEIPWSYLPVWFGITCPLSLLAGLALAAATARMTWQRATEAGERLVWGAVLLAAFFAPLYAIVRHSVLYDGLRHFFFVLPILAVLSATGWVRLLERLAPSIRARRPLALAAAAVAILLAGEPVVWLVRSHPYQYTYFNPLVGGLSGASHDYETDYWGLSLRDAARWLVDHRQQYASGGGPLVIQTNTYGAWQGIEPFVHPDEVRRAAKDERPQLMVVFYRFMPLGWDTALPSRLGPPVETFRIVPGQVPFFEIFAVPPPGAPATGSSG